MSGVIFSSSASRVSSNLSSMVLVSREMTAAIQLFFSSADLAINTIQGWSRNLISKEFFISEIRLILQLGGYTPDLLPGFKRNMYNQK